MAFTVFSFFQFYSLGQQDLQHFSFVLDRQDHIFEKLILEITKVNIYSLVIYTIKRSEMHCKLSVNAQNLFQL